MDEKKYTKKRLKIYQNGSVIFNRDVWICLEDTNKYYYHRDRDMRRIQYKSVETDSTECSIMLGIGDTIIVSEPLNL